jgi:antitoxin (DNA-binding transcriptional repressor) of toxin-antitoxin stability system
MKTLTVGDLKTNFSEVLKAVQLGEEFAIAFGKRKEVIAYLVPKQLRKKKNRTIGILEGEASVIFKDDFKMTAEEFLGP